MILDTLRFSSNPSNSIYLGLLILFGNSKRVAFQSIIDKVISKVDGWSAKTISQEGRLVLIKYVATTIPSYTMRTFLLPVNIYNKLDRSFKNFCWGFPFLKVRNLSLKSWNSLCIPKALGGFQTYYGCPSYQVSIFTLNLSSPPVPYFFLLALERHPQIPAYYLPRCLP